MTAAPLVWDPESQHLYETGCSKVALYPRASGGTYPTGVAWNGATGVKLQPDGGDAKSLFANDKEYLKLRSKEKAKGTITAYTYPDEWAACDGSKELVTGLYAMQQTRAAFGLCWRTAIGNDDKFENYGYKLHIMYGCTASPTESDYKSMSDDPEAIEMSWSFEGVGVDLPGGGTAAILTIDSTKFTGDEGKAKLKALEDKLYGTTTKAAYLPLPSEVYTTLGGTVAAG